MFVRIKERRLGRKGGREEGREVRRKECWKIRR